MEQGSLVASTPANQLDQSEGKQIADNMAVVNTLQYLPKCLAFLQLNRICLANPSHALSLLDWSCARISGYLIQ